jgi:hypothetical protein
MAEGTIAHLILGHLGLMFDIKHGLDYMQRLSDEYGDVVRVKGLGVRRIFITVFMDWLMVSIERYPWEC